MNDNQSKNKVMYGVLIFFIFIGAAIGYLLFFAAGDPDKAQQSADVEQEVSQIEKKIETINQTDEAYLTERYGKIETLFANCVPGLERKAITDRLACIRKDPKADKFWHNMQMAEIELKSMLLKKDIPALSAFLSCDAYDLTWYEMHCESDRNQVLAGHFKHLLDFVQKSGPTLIQEAVWQQRKPDKRLYRNPRWLLRSRLVNPQFKLIGPWKHEPHPTEKGTLIMLEQNLDGRIYIVGIPITGTFDE